MTDTDISRIYEMTERTKNMATEAERAVDLARGIWMDHKDDSRKIWHGFFDLYYYELSYSGLII